MGDTLPGSSFWLTGKGKDGNQFLYTASGNFYAVSALLDITAWWNSNHWNHCDTQSFGAYQSSSIHQSEHLNFYWNISNFSRTLLWIGSCYPTWYSVTSWWWLASRALKVSTDADKCAASGMRWSWEQEEDYERENWEELGPWNVSIWRGDLSCKVAG